MGNLPCGHARDVEAEVAAATLATLFFVNLKGTFDSLEISAFRFCELSKEAITIEYDGGSSYLSSSGVRGDVVDVVVCIVTTDA